MAGHCRLLSWVSRAVNLHQRGSAWSVRQAQVDGNGLRALDHHRVDACHFPTASVHTMQWRGWDIEELSDCRTKAALPHQRSVEPWCTSAGALPLQLSLCPLLSVVLNW